MQTANAESVNVMEDLKWPDKLNALQVGDQEFVPDTDEHAARKAKTRIEKTSDKMFTIRRVLKYNNELYVFRLK